MILHAGEQENMTPYCPHTSVYWRMCWEPPEAPLEERNEGVLHTLGQPLDLRATACMFGLPPDGPLCVWQASGAVLGIPTSTKISREEMRTRTGQLGSDAKPFLLEGRAARGKHGWGEFTIFQLDVTYMQQNTPSTVS